MHGAIRSVLTTLGSLVLVTPLSAFGSTVYWADQVTDGIHRADPDDPDARNVTTPFVGGVGVDCPDDPTPGNTCFQSPRDVAVDAASGRIYWVDSTEGAIRSAWPNGTDIVSHAYSFNTWFLEGIAVDPTGGFMYVADYGSGAGYIFRLAFTDVGVVKFAIPMAEGLLPIVTDDEGPRRIAIDSLGGRIYWTNEATGKVQRADLTGSSVQDVHTGLMSPFGIAIDDVAQKLYWSEYDGMSAIRRSNLDGSGVETLQSAIPGFVLDLALDPSFDRVLFSVGGQIRAAGLAPSDPITDLVAGLPGLNGIDILPVQVPALVPAALFVLGAALLATGRRSLRRPDRPR